MGGGVCKVIFMSNPTSVLRLCCVVVGVVKKKFAFKCVSKCFKDMFF